MSNAVGRTSVEYAMAVYLLAIALLHLYAPFFGIWAGLRLVSMVVFLCATLLIYHPWPKLAERSPRVFGLWLRLVYDGALLLGVIGVTLFIYQDFDGFFARTGYPTQADLIAGAIMLFVILEATRRSLGWPLVILCILFVLYALYGRSIPGRFAHAGTSMVRVIEYAFRDSSGILGLPIGVMASYVVIFIFIGSILERAGAGDFLLELSRRIVGKGPAGPAKIAVVSSALMGSISGSAVANVVTTGAFTIPLMKRIGLKPAKAAAVEAVASTGGLIMPPIMGAAAFIAAQNAGVTYLAFAAAAAIPALLYYFSLFVSVDLEGRKHDIRDGSGAADARVAGIVLWKEALWIVPPFGALIYMLLQGYSPGRAAGIALAMLAAGVLWRHGPMRGLYLLVDGLILGARASAPLIVAAAAAGIVIAMVYLSGLGLRFTSTIVAIAGDNLLLCLALVALATLILGMGLPITAAYLTAATLAVPPLKVLGVTDLAGHMFVFYFAALSAITPPVALASYAAAGVAGASFWTTSILAVRIGLIAFVVPFVFVYRPALLLWGAAPETVAYVVVTSLVGITAVSCAMVGYLNGRLTAAERLLLALCAAVLIVLPRFDLDLACIAIVAALAAFRYLRPGRLAGR